MMMMYSIIIPLLFCLSLGWCTDYWIMPSTVARCPSQIPEQNCITISDMVSRESSDLFSNGTIHFLTGMHVPTKSGWIAFKGSLETISIVGEVDNDCDPDVQCGVVIQCVSHKIGLLILSLTSLQITNFEIKDCGYLISDMPKNISLSVSGMPGYLQSTATILVDSVGDFSLTSISITNSTGFGLLVISYSRDSKTTILKTRVQYSNSKINMSNSRSTMSNPGGNIFIVLMKGKVFPFPRHFILVNDTIIASGRGSSTSGTWKKGIFDQRYTSGGLTIWILARNYVNIHLANSIFRYNKAPNGGGLYVQRYVHSTSKDHLEINITINTCKMYYNTAMFSGGALHFDGYTDNSRQGKENDISVSIWNSEFKNNRASQKGGAAYIKEHISSNLQYSGRADYKYALFKCFFQHSSATYGAAIYVILDTLDFDSDRGALLFNVDINDTIYNSNVASHNGGALFISADVYYRKFTPKVYPNFCIHNCLFYDNQAAKGSAISIISNAPVTSIWSQFYRNYSPKKTMYESIGGSVIDLELTDLFLLESCNITNNNCRAIYAHSSTVEIKGEVWIVNNTAKTLLGAGIYLTHNFSSPMSQLILNYKNALLYIIGNQGSHFGGGIAIQRGCLKPESCFFKIKVSRYFHSTSNTTTPVIDMRDNTATVAGDTIYGGDLDQCKIDISFGRSLIKQQKSAYYFWSYFNIDNRYTSTAVASQPYKVCICTSKFSIEHDCRSHYSVKVFPGETFKVPVVGVGQYNYSSPSVIRADVHQTGAVLDERWRTQDTGLTCTNLSYSVLTLLQNHTISLILAIDTLSYQPEVSSHPTLHLAQVEVTIQECLHGFEINGNTKACDCKEFLLQAGVTCDIDNQRIHKTPTMWIGDFSGEIVVHYNCPFDYCKLNVSYVNPYEQQEQCDFQRDGVLCGGCRPGLSLTLGTSQCKKCSNIYLLLLIPFAVAGVALVVLLLKCNLTVSTGTINGLIFFANILQANHSVFFPKVRGSSLSHFLSIFIAWLNLDLGVEACFSENLNSYTRTWLQFVFPIYIWLLVGLLIVISRYSITVSRLTGTNTVPVLATLFLLSYAKLLRATLTTFSSTVISGPNDTRAVVWLADGNYSFGAWPHILLLIFAIVIFITYLIPFTFICLFSPILQSYSDRRLLQWVSNIRPFIDAYQGPYKIRFRFWTGFMLLIRLILFLAFTGNVLGNPSINILLIAITSVLLLCVWWKISRIYRHKLHNYLEVVFLVKLTVFAAIALYLNSTSTSNQIQEVIACITVGSSFIIFIGILGYHIFTENSKTRLGKCLIKLFTNLFQRRSITSTQNEFREENVIEENEVQLQPVQKRLPTCTVVDISADREPLLN